MGKMALIKVKSSRISSDFLVYEVDSRSAADLLIYRVNTTGPARSNDELWCFVDSDSQADSKICFISTI